MFATWSKQLLQKMSNQRYRAAYIAEHVRTGIAYQIRAMREQRNGMSQGELGKLMGKPQSVISRLENPDYGKVTLQTLLDVAAAFDVALIVQFVSHADFLWRSNDVSQAALKADSFDLQQFDLIVHEPLAIPTYLPKFDNYNSVFDQNLTLFSPPVNLPQITMTGTESKVH